MVRHRIKGWVCCASVLCVVLGNAYAQVEPKKGEAKLTVLPGKEVSLEYTLRLEDKQVVDTNVGGAALTFTQGTQQIIPGLEVALEGMAIGETKQVTIAPAEGYGDVNPKAFQEVPKKSIPPSAKVGTQLHGQSPDGRVLRPRVAKINDDTVVLDFNHPLAGKTLYFEVKVLAIE